MFDRDKLQQRIENYMTKTKSRGLAIAVIDKDSEYVDVFGSRNQKGDAVTVDTIFPIASVTKTFTGAMAVALQGDNVISLKDKLIDNLPGFGLSDSIAEQEVTIEDALSHRSGLARNEFAWMYSGFDMQQVVDHIKYLPMLCPMRTTYHYTNIMFTAVCRLVELKTGKKWWEVMKQYVTDKIGMEDITFSVSDTVAKYSDYATPFAYSGSGEIVDLPLFSLDNVAGCGAINTSITELVKYLKYVIGQGTVSGQQILTREEFCDMTTDRIDASNSMFWRIPAFQSKSYAIGWQSDVYKGYKLLRHTGGINGFASFIVAIPEKDIGVVIVNNTAGRPIEDLIGMQLIDEMLGEDNIAEYENMYFEVKPDPLKATLGKYLADQKAQNLPLSLPIDNYQGKYQFKGYPDITITNTDKGLLARFGQLTFPLEHCNKDMFVINYGGIHVPFAFKVTEDEVSLMANVEHNISYPLEFRKI